MSEFGNISRKSITCARKNVLITEQLTRFQNYPPASVQTYVYVTSHLIGCLLIHKYKHQGCNLSVRRLVNTYNLTDCLHLTKIENVTFGLLYAMFRFSIKTFYRGVTGFEINCPCGVWCRGLTTCSLYVVPLFENIIWNYSGFISLT